MSTPKNRPTDGPGRARTMLDRLTVMFSGQDLAVMLGTLTSFVTLVLDDSSIPLDVFIEGLRGSERTLQALQADGASVDAGSEAWALLSADDRAALRDAFHCLTHHCNRFDEHHARARVVVNRLAGRDSDG